MKKLIFLIVILVLLGGGAVGAMAVFGIGPFAKAEKTVAAPPPPAKVSYVDMDALSIPVFITDQKPRQVYMTLRLEIKDTERKKVEAMMPRIRDNILTDLHKALPEHLKNRKTTDLNLIKPRMVAQAAKALGPGIVTDVLVVEIFER
ncbi:MAG: hypothetical protein EPN26_10815 [Rhodospirillales bacterium]|nr:MAG: hypothetical protein EPN26_10815 [Rhodospirillales bacterium]